MISMSVDCHPCCMFSHLMQMIRTIFRFLFVLPILILSIDGMTPHDHPLNDHMSTTGVYDQPPRMRYTHPPSFRRPPCDCWNSLHGSIRVHAHGKKPPLFMTYLIHHGFRSSSPEMLRWKPEDGSKASRNTFQSPIACKWSLSRMRPTSLKNSPNTFLPTLQS